MAGGFSIGKAAKIAACPTAEPREGADSRVRTRQRAASRLRPSQVPAARRGPRLNRATAGQPLARPSAVLTRLVLDVLRGPGQPLAAPLRDEMGARLGADFSDVRVHAGEDARASAARLGARAYTRGSHVVLGDGADKRTVVHELIHVMQQREGPVAGRDLGTGMKVSDPTDRDERAAEAGAARILRGETPGPVPPAAPGRTGLVVQRTLNDAQDYRPPTDRAMTKYFINTHVPSEDDFSRQTALDMLRNRNTDVGVHTIIDITLDDARKELFYYLYDLQGRASTDLVHTQRFELTTAYPYFIYVAEALQNGAERTYSMKTKLRLGAIWNDGGYYQINHYFGIANNGPW
jgi:hypothetical protein